MPANNDYCTDYALRFRQEVQIRRIFFEKTPRLLAYRAHDIIYGKACVEIENALAELEEMYSTARHLGGMQGRSELEEKIRAMKSTIEELEGMQRKALYYTEKLIYLRARKGD